MDRYDMLKIETLVKTIQETAIKYSDPAMKKKTTTTAYAKHMREIREMKNSVIKKLSKMDRTKPEFFPLGSHVTYQHPDLPRSEDGTVQGYDQGKVVLKLDPTKSDMTILVWPHYLTLKFLRITY